MRLHSVILRERREGPLAASREAKPPSREPLANRREREDGSESCSGAKASVPLTSVCGHKTGAPHHTVPSLASDLQMGKEGEFTDCTVPPQVGKGSQHHAE